MDGRNLTFVGIATWVVVVIITVGWEIRSRAFLLTPSGLAWAALMVAFLVFFIAATWAECPPLKRIILCALQTFAALGAMALMTRGDKMEPILLVIIAGELGSLPFLPAMGWLAAQTAAFIFLIRGGGGVIPFTLAYLVFQLFAYFAVQIAHREAHARQELAETHAELRVTSGLLDISSRTEERLRIARELHDLVGHHLAALSLNLEVASHLTSGEAKESVEKSQAITKKLLTDVREVVSRLREDEPVDLTAAVGALRDVIATPALHLDVGNVAVTDSAIAQIALRTVQEIVTNAVRHSGARNLWLRLASVDHTLEIDARDDGSGTDQIQFGNGLRGIRERVEAVNGSMEVSSMRGAGFSVKVMLPIEA